MKNFLYKIYRKLPLKLRLKIQEALPILASQKFNVISGRVHYNSNSLKTDFIFYAPIRMFNKASKKGIENAIIKNIQFAVNQKKEGIILDVGLNYGFLSLVWSKLNKSLEIIGFEANQYILDYVKRAITENNISNFKVHNVFVSDQDQNAVRVKNGLNTGVYSYGNLIEEKSELIDTITVDQYFIEEKINKPLLAIKIDTDGADYEVLKGSEKVIDMFMPYIAIELNGDIRILEFLNSKGYILRDMNGVIIDLNSKIDVNKQSLCNVFASSK